ncbi:Protein-L-isoaspartate O-methyltransferase [uncultured archaeon]|nr:Protein-L-isoaspartate O-methyltransferase [uncultured archaeon]
MNKKLLLNHLNQSGFSNEIITAFNAVKREDFIPQEFKKQAYENIPLPIGFGATISQPYTIAFMLSLLEITNLGVSEKSRPLKILEVGSGSGYVLALINVICKNCKIYGIELIRDLSLRSQEILREKPNIMIFNRNGSKGLEEYSPYDRIIVSASADKINQELIKELNYNGVLVIPVGNSIIKLKKKYRENEITEYPGFVFVPLIDKER